VFARASPQSSDLSASSPLETDGYAPVRRPAQTSLLTETNDTAPGLLRGGGSRPRAGAVLGFECSAAGAGNPHAPLPHPRPRRGGSGGAALRPASHAPGGGDPGPGGWRDVAGGREGRLPRQADPAARAGQPCAGGDVGSRALALKKGIRVRVQFSL